MFGSRSEELLKLIERFQSCDDTLDSIYDRDLCRNDIECFSTLMIEYMVADKILDREFMTISYNFDPEFCTKVFCSSIERSYDVIGCPACLNLIIQLRYFEQGIEGMCAVFDIIISRLPQNNIEVPHNNLDAYYLLEKLYEIKKYENFEELQDRYINTVNKMIDTIEFFFCCGNKKTLFVTLKQEAVTH